MSTNSANLIDLRTPLPRAAQGRDAGASPADWPLAAEVKRVLVVENNENDAAALVSGLRRHGYEAHSVATGSAALQTYREVDLILLDFELPDLDGLEVCRGIRSVDCVPVIAVTARGSELDRVLGLRAGADDYLVKPYGFSELIARMDAVLRRSQPRTFNPDVIDHGPLRIDAGTRQVTLDGRPIDVTRKEFDLLHLLATRPDSVIPRKQLMHQVWGDTWSRRTVDTHVSSLRGKLGSSEWIITVRGVGFRLGRAPRTSGTTPEERRIPLTA